MVVTARPQPSDPEAAGGDHSPDRSTSLWLLAGIVLLGVVVRFTTLGEQSFWYDEAVTHGIVAHGLGHVLSTVPKTESTPPLYYVLVWLWSRVFGLHEAGLRSFSALCGTLTIPVVFSIGRRCVSDRVGLVAALLTAVNPLLFWYSQEARSYALLLLLSAVSLRALVWALESPTWRRLLGWGALSALALCAHYFAAFLIVAEGMWLLVALRRAGIAKPARLAAAFVPIVAIAAALAPLLVHQDDGRAGFIANSGSLAYRVAQLVKQDIVANDEPAKVFTSIVACVLVLIGLLLLVRRANARERRAAVMFLALGGGAVLLALLVAAFGSDYVNTRNLLPSWPPLVLLVAIGLGARGFGARGDGVTGRGATGLGARARGALAASRVGALTLAALVVVSLVCIVGVITTPIFQRDDWRGAARAMGPATVPRAIVGDHLAGTALGPYMTGLANFPASARIQEIDVFGLVYRRPGATVSSSPARPAAPPVVSGFKLVQTRETGGYTVLRYRAPVPLVEPLGALASLGVTPDDGVAVLLQPPA